jgi:hypothetical protein
LSGNEKAMKRSICLGVLLIGISSAISSAAQSLTSELDATSGYSTDDHTGVAAVQVRTFGEFKPQLQFFVEGTWARRSGDTTDTFNAAYPYNGRAQFSEAYAERSFQHGSLTGSVRGGQYRTPFGIYSRADHGYLGFLRAPLMRSEYNWAISNTMMERGVDFMFGTPRFSGEVSISTPGDISGDLKRRPGLGSVVRIQAYIKTLIVGVSHINSPSNAPAEIAEPGRMDFTGVDLRWTYGGIQVRGEWLTGKQWDNGTKTWGGYLDAIVHRPSMGPVTAVFRTEQLDFEYPFSPDPSTPSQNGKWRGLRHTAGARIRIPGGLTAQFNVLYHSKNVAYERQTAFDMALTYSFRANTRQGRN